MPIQCNSTAEAYVAVGLVVLAADGHLTAQEAQLVFESMQEMPIFEGRAGFIARQFLAQILSHSSDPPSAAGSTRAPSDRDLLLLDEDLLTEVIRAARQALDATQRENAYCWAVKLAFADGFIPQEAGALYRLAEGLGIDRAITDTCLQDQD